MDKDETNLIMQCRICREEIKNGANKCIHCGSFQDWRRFINFSNTVLALLVALASVLSWGIPTVKEAFKKDKSEIVFGLQNVSHEGITMLISNTGTKAGGLSDATLDMKFHVDKLTNGNKTHVVQPSGSQLRLFEGQTASLLNKELSYSLHAASSDNELVSTSPYLKPGQVEQFVFKIIDILDLSEMKLLLGDDIKELVNRKAKEKHEESEFKGLLPMDYLFSEELKNFFKKSECTLKFTAINYNGETTRHIINKSCDLLSPYLKTLFHIENPHIKKIMDIR